MKNEQGEIIAAMEMNLDITHLKKLEEKLNRSEKQYYAFFNQIPNPVFVIDAETLSIIDCNESVESVYGFNKSEVLERPFLDFFFDEDRKSLEREIKELNEINRVKHMKKDGEVLYVNIRISPSEYPGQKVFLVTTSDVTKRLESELQLVQAGKMATLGEMATGVAHELNQPLSVIKTASNFLMKKIRKKEKIQEDTLLTMAEEIDGHVDRASGIISHLRQFGRKSDITLERVQVNDALERSFEMFRQQLKLRQIEVGWDLKKNLPPIMAELSQLEQVFINLLINARDAIEEKWKTDNLNKQEDKTISLKTFSSGNYVCIEICDNGTGIPKNRISKVFEPFYTTKGIGEGTGIGLSISYRIIEEFKGQIKVVSTEGSGTCFTIQLPKSEKD